MRREWQVQEAKSRLSALLIQAQRDGPQTITRHGEPVAVVVSSDEFRRLTAKPKTSLAEFFANSPLAEIEIEERDRADAGREIEL